MRAGSATSEDLRSIEDWRAAHRAVLNTFQASLRTRTRNRPIVVAQRHKRQNTVFNKLRRIPKMELSRMDDIADCRLILNQSTTFIDFENSFIKPDSNISVKIM